MKKILSILLWAVWIIQPNYAWSYDAVDSSPQAQRLMAEQHTVKAVLPADDIQEGLIPIYTESSATSGQVVNNTLAAETFYDSFELACLDDSRPGWLFIVDLAGKGPSGWVESSFLRTIDFGDHREVGYLVTLNLGTDVPDIMRRWGPGTVKEKEIIENWRGSVEHTVMSFDGFDLSYEDHRNFNFTLTRKGAGLGGIFVGAAWCDREYIQKTFGPILTIDKQKPDDGQETWSMSGGPDGWSFVIVLTFDQQGLVREFRYNCADVDLS